MDELARGIQDYLGHLAVERGLADNTLKSYRRDLVRYGAHLSHRAGPEDVTEQDVLDFVAALRTGDADHPPLASASVARTVVAIRGLHKFWLREAMVTADVAAAVKPPRPARRLPKALPHESVMQIVEAAGAAETALAKRDRALLDLLYATGARISEAVGLDIDDVDLDEETVFLRGKGGKQRIVPIGSLALASVADYLQTSRPGLVTSSTPAVFLNSRGGRLSRQSAWKILAKAAESAGITSEVSPHTLRHSFATVLLDNGVDVRVVQELLGHASVTTTQIYTLVTVEKLREVYATAHPRSSR